MIEEVHEFLDVKGGKLKHKRNSMVPLKSLQTAKNKNLPVLSKRFKSNPRGLLAEKPPLMIELPFRQLNSKELRKREDGFNLNFNSVNYELDKKKKKKIRKAKEISNGAMKIPNNARSIEKESRSPSQNVRSTLSNTRAGFNRPTSRLQIGLNVRDVVDTGSNGGNPNVTSFLPKTNQNWQKMSRPIKLKPIINKPKAWIPGGDPNVLRKANPLIVYEHKIS